MPNTEKKILIVDDISTNRILLKIMCEKLGYESEIAGSGREALEMFKTNHYDLIFLDCQMPIMDGYEVSREIRKLEKEGEHTPLVAITAYVFSENKEKCLSAGMNDFLGKPLKKHELKTIIERWLKPDTEIEESPAIKAENEDYFSVEVKPEEKSTPKSEIDDIMKMFVESTVNKFVSFQKYLHAKDDKFCMIGAVGLKNNFKLVNSEPLMKISTDLTKACLEKNYEKCEDILEVLKVEFENFANEKNFNIKI